MRWTKDKTPRGLQHMLFDLDHVADVGPNPPPWYIHYVNDQEEEAIWYNGVLPEAHTHGINQFNDLDLQIRKAPPNVAAAVLDKVGLYLLAQKKKAKLGDRYRVTGTDYLVTPALDSSKRPVLRLAWYKDPKPNCGHTLTQFHEACKKLGITMN